MAKPRTRAPGAIRPGRKKTTRPNGRLEKPSASWLPVAPEQELVVAPVHHRAEAQEREAAFAEEVEDGLGPGRLVGVAAQPVEPVDDLGHPVVVPVVFTVAGPGAAKARQV